MEYKSENLVMSSSPEIINDNASITKYSVNSDTEEFGDVSPRKKLKLSICNQSSDKDDDSQDLSRKFNDKDILSIDFPSGKLTLWQFLLELLMSEEYSNLIKWTDRNIGEFILIQAEEVAKLWGIRKDRNHRMNYDKLSRALRYYYQKNIIKKVHGHKFVYRFVSILPEMLPLPIQTSSTISMVSNSNSINSLNSSNIAVSRNGVAKIEPKSNIEPNSPNENNNPNPSLLFNHSMTNQNLQNHNLTNSNNLAKDFNSTLAALFQAALMSVNNTNNNNNNNTNSNNTNNNFSTSNLFSQNQSNTTNDCYCAHQQHSQSQSAPPPPPPPPPHPQQQQQPEYSTSAIHPPSSTNLHQTGIDRQSLLHFSRHSINMQRLSQEILLHSCTNSSTKSRNSSNTTPPQTNPLPHSLSSNSEHLPKFVKPEPQIWLNQIAQNLWSSLSNQNPLITNNTSSNIVESQPIINPEPPVISHISTTKDSVSTEPNCLINAFQSFLNDFKKRTTTYDIDSTNQTSPSIDHHITEYSQLDLNNLVKTQLESKPNFVWMPIPAKFAEYFLNSTSSTAQASSSVPSTSSSSSSTVSSISAASSLLSNSSPNKNS